MIDDPRYEVQNPEIETLLRGLAGKIFPLLPEGWGASLFICSFGDGGSSFYISSMERESFLEAMQEFMVRNGYVLLTRPARQADDIGRKSDA